MANQSRWTQEQIDGFKSENPEIFKLRGKVHTEVEVIVKPCGRAQWARFMSTLTNADGAKRALAMKQLLFDCLVAPDRAEMEVLEERYPGLLVQLADEVRAEAGAGEEIEKEKL